MFDTTVLKSKTCTRLIIVIEDLLKLLPKKLQCPEVLHAKTAIKAHDHETKKKHSTIKPAYTRKKRLENILNYRAADSNVYRKTKGSLS